MKLNFKEPSIVLKNYFDGRLDAWKYSRPHLEIKNEDEELSKIANLNLPVNGFAYLQFEITSSLLMRDILYMVRPSNNWARSNRTTLVTEDNLYYSSEYKQLIRSSIYEGSNCKAMEYHMKSIDQNIPQDIRKNYFLYAVSTSYSFACNPRTLSNLIYSLKDTALSNYATLFEKALEDYDKPWNERCAPGDEIHIELPPHNDFNIFESMSIDLKSDLGDYLEVKEYPELGLVSIDCELAGSLSSQLQRQESGIIRSSLIYDIYRLKDLEVLPASQIHTVRTQVIVSRDVAIKIAKTRSCWFAQFDKETAWSWSRIVYAIAKELNLSKNDLLICQGDYKKCKFFEDQLAKLKAGNPEGTTGEVNLPCPFITGLPEVYLLRKKKFDSDSKLMELWKDIVTDNTIDFEVTEYGEELLKNIAKYGYAEKSDNEKLKEETEYILDRYKELI